MRRSGYSQVPVSDQYVLLDGGERSDHKLNRYPEDVLEQPPRASVSYPALPAQPAAIGLNEIPAQNLQQAPIQSHSHDRRPPAAVAAETWACSACTFENDLLDEACQICRMRVSGQPHAHQQRQQPSQIQPASPQPGQQLQQQFQQPGQLLQQPGQIQQLPQQVFPAPAQPRVVSVPVQYPAPVQQPRVVSVPVQMNPRMPNVRRNMQPSSLRRFRDYFWCACVTMFCCFIPSFPCGLIAMLNSVRARSAASYGDDGGAARWAHRAKQWIIGAIIFGIILRALAFLVFSEDGMKVRFHHGEWGHHRHHSHDD